jgi:hypothetical protein
MCGAVFRSFKLPASSLQRLEFCGKRRYRRMILRNGWERDHVCKNAGEGGVGVNAS